MDIRWLEFGVTAGLLILVIVYILRYHIPRLIQAFEQGLERMAAALKENTDELRDHDRRIHELMLSVGQRLDDTQSKHAESCENHRKEIEGRLTTCIERAASASDKSSGPDSILP